LTRWMLSVSGSCASRWIQTLRRPFILLQRHTIVAVSTSVVLAWPARLGLGHVRWGHTTQIPGLFARPWRVSSLRS
ncbi:hypothetical protein H0H92_001393, partial [Tricholoma furcatifolium]